MEQPFGQLGMGHNLRAKSSQEVLETNLSKYRRPPYGHLGKDTTLIHSQRHHSVLYIRQRKGEEREGPNLLRFSTRWIHFGDHTIKKVRPPYIDGEGVLVECGEQAVCQSQGRKQREREVVQFRMVHPFGELATRLKEQFATLLYPCQGV